MASALPLLLLLALGAQDRRPLPISLVYGVAAPGRPIEMGQLGLGSAGLLPRERWGRLGRREDGAVVTRGGVVVRVEQPFTRVLLPSGSAFELDEAGRVRPKDGEWKTEAAVGGIVLRFGDGSEVRLQPGSRGPRQVSVVEGERELVLARRGLRLPEARRAEPCWGWRVYAGDQGRLFTITDVGPCLWIVPMQRMQVDGRLVVLGDLLRWSASELDLRTPRNGAQYPLLKQQNAFLADVVTQLLPAERALHRDLICERGAGLALALSDGVHLQWTRRGSDPERTSIVLGLHLEPAAPASLEWVTRPGGPTDLFRVLPTSQQTRSRYAGRGVEASERWAEALPWPLPLAHADQRRLALQALRPYLTLAAPGE